MYSAGEIDRKEKLFKLCDIIFEDSHFAIDAPINKIHQNINATNDALNGVETVTKSDENTPGTCFSYNILQIKPLQKNISNLLNLTTDHKKHNLSIINFLIWFSFKMPILQEIIDKTKTMKTAMQQMMFF